ncbi:MAG: FHA domain-containing protein [Myxococcales bacterium]|nr:FHA domain-containing protein [Myxococcales bacterium]
MYKLVILDDKGHTTVVPLLRDEITIGRQDGNSIRLTERNVSRSHARLLKRNQAYIVEDLGSYNGVTVNGERIEEKAELAVGDQLGIGDYDLAFQSDAPPTQQRMPSPAPKPKSAPPPRLVVLSDPVTGAEFSLSKPVLRIGRDERLDIWINHKSISHEHAEVQLKGGAVTVFDLDSANGMRVNGVPVSRAVLEAGDILELGKVRFRFVPPEGSRSLDPVPLEAVSDGPPASSRKAGIAISVIALLLVAGAGAVLTTMRTEPERIVAAERPPVVAAALPPEIEAVPPEPASAAGDSDGQAIAEPQEWEGRLAQALEALAGGEIDEAHAIANDLPADSVLRETPEFGEIRYRYAQSHISDGERALEARDFEQVRRKAKLVLALDEITSKQRSDAKRLMRRARAVRPAREQVPKREAEPVPAPDPNLALEEAYACVARGDNGCVIEALGRGKARSPAALALLIETYRAMDDLVEARRHMNTFVKRYPDNPRTPKYSQMLASE